MAAAETKIIYHLDDQETPYLVKLPIPAERVTLGDFKALLNRPNYKFYFKSMDDDFGILRSFNPICLDDSSPPPPVSMPGWLVECTRGTPANRC
ncbi:hypothetical protein lerEdw1_015873 [Lerista edwardsae]|nr:hypothetical protein lerEdw1_015873 [Lerista edwardsae]